MPPGPRPAGQSADRSRPPPPSRRRNRTGVQLKDKWRNLVKFRHISSEESKKLQPKTSGPWSRKYQTAAHTYTPRWVAARRPGRPPRRPAAACL
jgi:hypothetical protein